MNGEFFLKYKDIVLKYGTMSKYHMVVISCFQRVPIFYIISRNDEIVKINLIPGSEENIATVII